MPYTFTVSLGAGATPLSVPAGALSLVSGPGSVFVSVTAVMSSSPPSAGQNGAVTMAQATLSPGGLSSVGIPALDTFNVYPANAVLSETPPPAWVAGQAPDPRMMGAEDLAHCPWPVKPPPFTPTAPLGTTTIQSVSVTAGTSTPGVYEFQVS